MLGLKLDVAVEDKFAGDWPVDVVFARVLDSILLDQVEESASSRMRESCCPGPEDWWKGSSGEWMAEVAREEVAAAVPPRSP